MADHVIDSGVCYQIHTYRILEYTCLGTLLSIIQGVICFSMFGYSLRQMQRNHRRALAGYTKNTINIDVHMNLMVSIALWYLVWGIINLFDSTDDVDLVELEGLKYRRITGWSFGFIYGFTSFIEVSVLVLLCSPSVGKNAFRVSGLLALAWGVAVFITITAVTINDSGVVSNYFPYRNFVYSLSARSFGTIAINVFTLWFYGVRKSVTKRPAVVRYSNYLVVLHCGLAVSYMLELSHEHSTINLGLCTGDFTLTYFFLTFAPRAYLALKRDCQYWSSDLGDDDEEDQTMNAQNETITWSELPNYKDVVIPKTELYFRSRLQERMDTSVETHLWRRKIVIVKRFKFDFLTRDSIKFFKREANIFKVLKHENIVKFFGVVVDPPSLGIVMQFGANGDLFQTLEKKRNSYTEDDEKKNMTSRKSIGLLRPYAVDSSRESEGDDIESALRPSEDTPSIPRTGTETGPRRRGESNTTRRQTIASRVMSMTGMRSITSPFGSSSFEPLYCALQVAQGMSYLHSQNVIHRDLKSLNVLLDEDYNALISDFGESAFDNIGGKTDRKSDTAIHGEPIGTAGWAAPEALNGAVTKASDVFSFGVLLWELVTWRAPAVLVPVGVLLEPPLCFVPEVLEALNKFREAHINESNLPRESDVHYDGVELKEQTKRSDDSTSARRRDIRLGENNSIRDPLTQGQSSSYGHPPPRGAPAHSDKGPSVGNAFSAVFSKISSTTSPGNQPSAAELTRGIAPTERLLIDVSDMTIAMELMYNRGYLPPIPVGIPQELCDLMMKCWEWDPASRPTFSQVLADLDHLFRTMNGMPHLPANVSCELNCRDPTHPAPISEDSGKRSQNREISSV